MANIDPSAIRGLVETTEAGNRLDRGLARAIDTVGNTIEGAKNWWGGLNRRSRAVLGMAALSLVSVGGGMLAQNGAEAQGSHVGRVTVEDDSASDTGSAKSDFETYVEGRMDLQEKDLVEKGADADVAERVVAENAKVFFAGAGEDGKISPEKVAVERGKIFETRADGVCLIETYNGNKVMREFGHVDFEGLDGEQAKQVALESLCPSGDVRQGVNIEQVAQTLAIRNLLQTGGDPNDLEKLAEATNGFARTIENGSPQDVQALYETARNFLNNGTFGTPEESPDRYGSVFVDAEGIVHAVDVNGRQGAMHSPATLKGIDENGNEVIVVVDWGDCGQIRVIRTMAPPVVVETPPPARAVVPPAQETSTQTLNTTHRASYTVCIGLDENGEDINHTEEAMADTLSEAQDAARQEAEAYAAEHGTTCELRETTTTTSTPETTSTTTTTTTPGTTSTLVTTTTSTTTPDSTTTTTVGFEVCTNPDGSTTTIPLGTECKIDNHGTDGNGTAGTEQTNEQNGHDNHGDANNSGNGEGTEEGTELGATDTDINDSSSNHGTNSNTGNLPGSAGEVAEGSSVIGMGLSLEEIRRRNRRKMAEAAAKRRSGRRIVGRI